jgi:RND family efflux transporter MFP subunit
MSQRMKILLPAAVIVGAILLAALVIAARPTVERVQTVAPPPLVRVVAATVRDVELSVASQGTVRPRTESVLVAQVAGQVDSVSPRFAAGGFFRRGEVLVRIDSRDYELAVQEGEARVAQAGVRLQLEQAEAEIARDEWEDLGEGEPSSLTLREPQLAEARANLQAAQAVLDKAKLDLERTSVVAPFDGRVSEKRADRGQFIARGAALAAVYATDVAEVELPVSRDDLAFLDLDLGHPDNGLEGPETRLVGRVGNTEQVWSARIVRTGSRFDPKTRMLSLYAEVKDPFARRAGATHPPLPMGLFVEAEIAGHAAPDVAVLPRAAIRDGSRVFVVDSDDHLRFRDVTVLRFEGDRALVTAGVEAGERVCLSALETAVDGMTVRTVVDEDSAGEEGK